MIRQDKFGGRIYSDEVWSRMLATGKKLEELAYTESKNKPNLFYSKREYGIFYADMRGSDVVAIWDDPRPLFYWQFNEDQPHWKCRSLVKEELLRLGNNGAKCRLTFYLHNQPIFEDCGASISEDELIFEWDVTHCPECPNFEQDGKNCTRTCEKQYMDKWREQQSNKMRKKKERKLKNRSTRLGEAS